MARYRRRKSLPPRIVRPAEVFDPQVRIVMTRDVVGKKEVNGQQQLKYQLRAGQAYYIDIDKAAEFITKGYATGELPRKVSDDEAAEWRAQMTVVQPGGTSGS